MESYAGDNVSARYNGNTQILCGEHDYHKFPGLSDDLSTYARNWQGRGWDDIKVNVEYAERTKILVGSPIVRQWGQPSKTAVIIAKDVVRNDSSQQFETTVQLKGVFENTLKLEVQNEMTS